MSNYEQVIKQLIETSPSWEKDGGGVRGRTIAPLLSGLSSSGGMAEFVPQQFNQSKSEIIQRSAQEPIADLVFSGGGDNAVFNPHPWQVLLRTTEDEITEYKVELNSNLYSGIGSWDNINITGLDFWTPISEGFLVLFGVVSGGVCTEASIQGPQAVPSDRIDFVGEEQSSFASQIAYLYQDVDGGWVVRQLAFSDLTLVDFCVNGKSAIYPIAS